MKLSIPQASMDCDAGLALCELHLREREMHLAARELYWNWRDGGEGENSCHTQVKLHSPLLNYIYSLDCVTDYPKGGRKRRRRRRKRTQVGFQVHV